MGDNTQGAVYSGPSAPVQAPETLETESPKPAKTRRTFVVLAVFVTLLLAVATGYLIFSRSTQSAGRAWVEYSNKNGFTLSYPDYLNATEDANSLLLSGASELSFKVGEMSGKPLREVVGEAEGLETFTADSRTGYKIVKEGAAYYYFPLFDDNYLEVISRGESEEIVSKLRFVTPQSASVN